jgi:alkanesulfonate monooxygenase SsuD/methylene tetrahydromethanopterin reductase-like flavin-dependent oxidoreductase (luciferase family)
LAARTTRLRLGVLVSSNTFRHPPLLAKEAVTVDHISNGRLEVGLGAGWFVPEHVAFGLPFPEPPELVARFRESVRLIDLLLRQDVTTFDGDYYQVADAPLRPGPVQRPRPPLTLGAHRPKMLRIVAEYADRWNSHASVAEMAERNQILDEQCAAVGRDPRAIIRSLYGWASQMGVDPWASPDAFHDVIGRYQDAGVSEFLLDAPAPGAYPMMERIMGEVVPSLRRARPVRAS